MFMYGLLIAVCTIISAIVGTIAGACFGTAGTGFWIGTICGLSSAVSIMIMVYALLIFPPADAQAASNTKTTS